jgi:ribosome modulation factor
MSQTLHHDPLADPITEGAYARARGRPKDACPYPANSPARIAWLEGYDGLPTGPARDLPSASA